MVITSWALQRRWQRVQRPIAVLLLSLGAFLMWSQDSATPPAEATAVAVADVAAGEIVQPGDVQVVQWPVASRPQAAARSPDEFVGRTATAAIAAGEPLTAARVAGPGALSAIGADVVAVRLPDDALTRSGLIRAGDRVNVVGQTQSGVRTLVSGAIVLTVTQDQGIIVAVPATNAAQVVQAASSDSSAVVLLAG